jgi:hypothetical protein
MQKGTTLGEFLSRLDANDQEKNEAYLQKKF